MNSSITQWTLSESNHDQSASQAVSKSKKTANGKQKMTGLFDLIGGEGSFASIMKQKGIFFSIEKDNNKKESSISFQMESTAGKDEVAGELHGVRDGQKYLSKKGTKVVNSGIDAIPFVDQRSLDKDMKLYPETSSSKVMADIKTKGEVPVEKLGKTQTPTEKGSIDKERNKLNLPEGSPEKDIDAGQIKSTVEKNNKISLKKTASGLDGIPKSPSREATLMEEITGRDSELLSIGSLKGNAHVRKEAIEGMRVSRSAEGSEENKYDGDLDLSKVSDIKEVKISKVSNNTKEHETLLKSDSLKPEGAKGNTISSDQLIAMSENTQGGKSVFEVGLKFEKNVERGKNETFTVKTDASLWTAQVDYSAIRANDSRSWININEDIITPLRFQDVADQIMEDASYMLKKGSGRIVITLEPPNLGTLNMDVRVQHDTVRMLLIADNQEVKQVLHSNLDQLKTALQGQGLNVDRFDVLVQERHYDSNQGFQPGGGTMFEEGRGRQDNGKEDRPAPQMAPSGGSEVNEPSLGIISLFV